MGSIPFGVVKWLELIWLADLPPNSKYLCAYLRTFMNDKSDMAWPSYTRISSETGLSRPTISRHFDYLDSEGWLSRDKGNSNKSTRYYACIPDSVNEKLISDAIGGGSNASLLRSNVSLPKVVTSCNSNKQLNKQDNKQSPLLGKIVDMYLSIVKDNCNAKGCLKDHFLSSKERIKPLLARISENEEHQREEFWQAYFNNCKTISWIRDGIDGEAVCTIDMLINKTKFYRNVEAFWA